MRKPAGPPAILLACLAAVVYLPARAASQTVDLESEIGVRVTPFAGYAPAFHRIEQRRIVIGEEVLEGAFETSFASGPAAGVLFEVRSAGPLRVSAGALLVRRAETSARSVGVDSVAGPGARHAIAKVALGLRFNEANPAEQIHPFNASVFAGPAYVLELSSRDAVSGLRSGPLGSWAANLGADVQFPLGTAVALDFGVEDFAVLWSESALERRTNAEFALGGIPALSIVHARVSHMWLMRAALTFVF